MPSDQVAAIANNYTKIGIRPTKTGDWTFPFRIHNGLRKKGRPAWFIYRCPMSIPTCLQVGTYAAKDNL